MPHGLSLRDKYKHITQQQEGPFHWQTHAYLSVQYSLLPVLILKVPWVWRDHYLSQGYSALYHAATQNPCSHSPEASL